MTPQDLLAAFETLAEAPEGVTRLRELVLQLAVRGKLVPQNPEDEPASALLERIEKEKARLVKEGKIRKPKPLPPVKKDEVPFEVPPGWVWTRFGTITDARLGKMLDKAKNSGPLRPYLRNANLQWFEFLLDDIKQLRLEESELKECSLEVGDLVICEGGEPGRAAICDEAVAGMVYQKALHRARPYRGISSWYLAYLLRCDAWGGRLADLFTGATIRHLTGQSLASYTTPLPPPSEQHRIVAKVDELMGLLDRLEAARNTREATRAAVRDSALAALRDADTPEEVEVAWSRVAERMDDLFTAPADVDPLRQAVLQLAVRGRLVPQDPTDEPAVVLLERIEKEKARLVKEGKIPKPKPLPRVKKDEVPFEVPEGWAWVRLGNVLQLCRNGVSIGPNDAGVGYPLLRISAATSRKHSVVQLADHRYADLDAQKAQAYKLAPGDLLACRFNGNLHFVGRVAQVPESLSEDVMHPDKLIRIQAVEVSHRYLVTAINSGPTRHQVEEVAATTAGNIGINGKQMQSLLIAVPPLSEQHRIVAKVDELMGLLDRLEERLAAKTKTHNAFVAAAVHHMET
jgi:type I restriction enzyme, S subunit